MRLDISYKLAIVIVACVAITTADRWVPAWREILAPAPATVVLHQFDKLDDHLPRPRRNWKE